MANRSSGAPVKDVGRWFMMRRVRSWRHSYFTDGFLVFILALVVFELSVNVIWATDHTIAFTKLDFGLLYNHSAAFGAAGNLPPWTIDQFTYGGQNYSALAPGTAFLALPFMAAAFSLAGGFTAYGPALILPETFVSLSGAVAAYLVYKIARLYFRGSTSALLGFAFAFSTICWPFATYFFQGDVSAMFVLAAAYFALKLGRHPGQAKSFAALSGLAVGAAFVVDYVSLALIPILLAFAFFRNGGPGTSRLKVAFALGIGALPGLAMVGAYNMAIFGNPLVSTEAAYLGKSLLGEFSTPIASGLYLDLVSLSRGLFIFAPFAMLGVPGLVHGLRTRAHRAETALLLAFFLAILIPYSTWYDPTGGISFGPRFLIPAIPFVLIPAGYVVEMVAGVKRVIPYSFYAAGAVVNGMAAFVTAIPPVTNSNVSPFTTYILPHFMVGDYDSLWASLVWHPWPIAGLLVFVLGVVLPLATIEAARRSEITGLRTT